jgi:hypothetical protein
MYRLLAFAIVLVAAYATASAEIEKVAIPTDNGLTLHWWPKLPDVAGWHFDREASYHYGFAAWAPDNFTFSNAETVIYARAVYKPRDPERSRLTCLSSGTSSIFWRNLRAFGSSRHRRCQRPTAGIFGP